MARVAWSLRMAESLMESGRLVYVTRHKSDAPTFFPTFFSFFFLAAHSVLALVHSSDVHVCVVPLRASACILTVCASHCTKLWSTHSVRTHCALQSCQRCAVVHT
jgi:hypothetical protein